MRMRGRLVILSAALVAASGCASSRYTFNKPWGKGTWIPALVCAGVGAGSGIAIQNARQGCSTATVDGTITQDCSSKDLWKGAVIGAPIGAVVCGLLGHVFLDPEVATPTPPPTPTPTPEPLPPPKAKRIVLRGVYFDFDKSDIRPDSRPILDEAVETLREYPNIRIAVEGYTDSIGTDVYNEKLSVRRAEAVFRYLVNHGIAPERMEVIGYGETHPVASNDTEEGRAENRRVELHIVNQPEQSD
jgi:outer membrane protein OmpA-like peptidoglycan-associated protein